MRRQKLRHPPLLAQRRGFEFRQIMGQSFGRIGQLRMRLAVVLHAQQRALAKCIRRYAQLAHLAMELVALLDGRAAGLQSCAQPEAQAESEQPAGDAHRHQPATRKCQRPLHGSPSHTGEPDHPAAE